MICFVSGRQVRRKPGDKELLGQHSRKLVATETGILGLVGRKSGTRPLSRFRIVKQGDSAQKFV